MVLVIAIYTLKVAFGGEGEFAVAIVVAVVGVEIHVRLEVVVVAFAGEDVVTIVGAGTLDLEAEG